MAIVDQGRNRELEVFQTHADVPQAVKDDIMARSHAMNRAQAIAGEFAGVLGVVEAALNRIRGHVKGRRAAVAAEFGAEAHDLLDCYNHLKSAVEIGRGVTLKDLPE